MDIYQPGSKKHGLHSLSNLTALEAEWRRKCRDHCRNACMYIYNIHTDLYSFIHLFIYVHLYRVLYIVVTTPQAIASKGLTCSWSTMSKRVLL